MSNAPESQSGEDLLEKLTTAVSVDAASGPKASMAVARQVWRQRPGYWKSFFNRWKTTGIRTRGKVFKVAENPFWLLFEICSVFRTFLKCVLFKKSLNLSLKKTGS